RLIPVAEVKQLPGALRGDRRAFVVRGRAHRVATGTAGDVTRAGKLDRHDREGESTKGRFASRIAVQCILRLHASRSLRSLVQNPLRGKSGSLSRPRVLRSGLAVSTDALVTITRRRLVCGISILCLGRVPLAHLACPTTSNVMQGVGSGIEAS